MNVLSKKHMHRLSEKLTRATEDKLSELLPSWKDNVGQCTRFDMMEIVCSSWGYNEAGVLVGAKVSAHPKWSNVAGTYTGWKVGEIEVLVGSV